MAFDKTAARGPSRTRSAVSNVRLEVPLPLPPPFRGFLESAHSPTPHSPAAGGDGASGWGVVAPPGRGLYPVRLRRWDGGGKARTRRLLMSQKFPAGERDAALRFWPRASDFVQSCAWGRLARRRGARRRGGLRACTDCRRFVSRDQVTLKFHWLSPPPFRPGAGSPGPLAVRASFSFKICFPNKIFFFACFSPEIFRLKK